VKNFKPSVCELESRFCLSDTSPVYLVGPLPTVGTAAPGGVLQTGPVVQPTYEIDEDAPDLYIDMPNSLPTPTPTMINVPYVPVVPIIVVPAPTPVDPGLMVIPDPTPLIVIPVPLSPLQPVQPVPLPILPPPLVV
jgi:hypothetical protein